MSRTPAPTEAPTLPIRMEPVPYPIDGILDLHAFAPGDVRELVPDYVRLCRERGILRVRIIHGKGRGVLRRRVHALLDAMPEVRDFHLAGADASSWGATIVHLTPPDAPPADGAR